MNERSFELIQNIIEDRKNNNISIKPILTASTIGETRLLVDMVREAYPLYKDADAGTLIDFVQDIFGVQVSEKELKQVEQTLEPERIFVSDQYRPIKITNIVPGFEYEIYNPVGSIDGKKMLYGWIKETFPIGITNNITYNAIFKRIWDKAKVNHIRTNTKYLFKIGQEVAHIKDSNIRGKVQYRVPAGAGWNNQICLDLGKYTENGYLVRWNNKSDKTPLKNWYDESELLSLNSQKLEVKPMITNNQKLPRLAKKTLKKIKDQKVTAIGVPHTRDVRFIPPKEKKPMIYTFSFSVPDSDGTLKHKIGKVQVGRHKNLHDTLDGYLRFNYPKKIKGVVVGHLAQNILIYHGISAKETVPTYTKNKSRYHKTRKPKASIAAGKARHDANYKQWYATERLVCVKHIPTGVVDRMPKHKADFLVIKKEEYDYVSKVEWRKYLNAEQNKKNEAKPGLRKDSYSEDVGHVINRQTRSRMGSKKGSLKKHSKNVIEQKIPIEYPRTVEKKMVNVPVIKEVTKLYQLWDKAKEKVIHEYEKYERIITGYKEEMIDVIRPNRTLHKIILTTKPIKQETLSKEDRIKQSLKDKETHRKKKLAEVAVLDKEFNTYTSTGGNVKDQVNEVIALSKTGVNNHSLKEKIATIYNGWKGDKINRFLKYIKYYEKWSK